MTEAVAGNGNMTTLVGLEQAETLDAQDSLASLRQQFFIDDPDLIYMDGNSLGRLPLATIELLNDLVARQWGERLVRGWNEGWMDLASRIGAKIGRLIGADEGEVILADSTTVNLYKLLLAALRAKPQRHKIVTDDLNFPSDLYVLQRAAEYSERPIRVEVVRSPDGVHGPMEMLAQAIDQDTAVVTLSHTTFKSGYLYDMAAVNRLAQRSGAFTLWDLSHSAGVVPVDLNGTGCDLAVGCTYKYLNGGPGAPAFLFVRADLQQALLNPIAGWMGRADMFRFDLNYQPADGIRRFVSGTPPILSLAAIEPGVDMLLGTGIDRVRAKSVQQTEYLTGLWQELLAPIGFHLNSPPNADRRGSHVSLGHREGWRIDQALIQEMKVLPDFREPDNLRLGIAPLNTRFVDIWNVVARLRSVVLEKRYEAYNPVTAVVT